MRYLAISLFVLLPFCLAAQNRSAEQTPEASERDKRIQLVEKNLQQARDHYAREEYRKASGIAAPVIGEAAALGLDKQMREAQRLVVQCEQIQAFQRSMATSEGIGSAAIAIQLSELYFKNGEYEKAAQLASEAYEEAEEYNEKSFMATALNKEARAILKSEDAGKEEKAEARKKFRKSLKLLAESKVLDPILKKENLDYLEEFGDNIVSSVEFADTREAMRTAIDSVHINLGKWSVDGRDFFPPDDPDRPGPPPPVFGDPHRSRKKEEMYQKIVQLNMDRLTKELIAPLPPPDEAGVVVAHVTDEMKTLWPTQLKVIQQGFSENEERIGKMAPQDIREELLLTTYQRKYDSLMYLHTLDSINLEKQELDIRQRETELERQKVHRQFMMTSSGGALLLAFFLFIGFTRQKKSNRLLSQKNEAIRKEQERSEELLLNILPAQVAGELKQYGASKARRYENVSVLFSDFKDFSKIAETLSPEMLVNELDYCFKAFDNIVGKYALEKIKTIGDAYMCAGGLPAANGNNAAKTVQAALEMQAFLHNWQEEKRQKGEPFFEARIGIHTGPVVAGVVGRKKFAYDIWGDTVNIASRMESSGQPGRINISGDTYHLVGDDFPCSYRGKVQAKNKGEIDMYFVG